MGWSLRVTPHVRVRTLLNFPVQATAADMLRLAMCQAVEAGLMVCAPLHDSLMIECAIEDVDASVAQLQAIMRQASLLVLGGSWPSVPTPRSSATPIGTWTHEAPNGGRR